MKIIQFYRNEYHNSADRIAGIHHNGASATIRINHVSANGENVFLGCWKVGGRYSENIVNALIRRFEPLGYYVEVEGREGYSSYKTGKGWRY